MPPNQKEFGRDPVARVSSLEDNGIIKCAVLGCGMMGQEHISYIQGYKEARIDYLVDPFQPSLDKAQKIMKQFRITQDECYAEENSRKHEPLILRDEAELLLHADQIDLLVIATPNYLHTDSLEKWGTHDITILVEKPVAVSVEQHRRLQLLRENPDFKARIWVAMEYRFIPAITKLLSLIPVTVGELKMITIRENRYPFLHKVGAWNRDPEKTGDTLVEKCCHFFDLFRLITGREIMLPKIRALAQRGINYLEEPPVPNVALPVIDSAYVMMPFRSGTPLYEPHDSDEKGKVAEVNAIGCLELCMYAEGSRHQEEIIVTGTKGRLEAYLPENKVYAFTRPTDELWSDRSVPPPPSSIQQQIFDCSDVKGVHGIDKEMPTHGGYHYSSTAVEWYRLLEALKVYKKTGIFVPEVSLEDGMRAVEIGLHATIAILNEGNRHT